MKLSIFWCKFFYGSSPCPTLSENHWLKGWILVDVNKDRSISLFYLFCFQQKKYTQKIKFQSQLFITMSTATWKDLVCVHSLCIKYNLRLWIYVLEYIMYLTKYEQCQKVTTIWYTTVNQTHINSKFRSFSAVTSSISVPNLLDFKVVVFGTIIANIVFYVCTCIITV